MIVPPQTGSIEGAWSPSTSKKMGRVQENGQGPGNHVFLNVDRNPKKIMFFLNGQGPGKHVHFEVDCQRLLIFLFTSEIKTSVLSAPKPIKLETVRAQWDRIPT